MAALSTLHKLIKVMAPGAPEPTIDFALLESARRFCSLSWWARRSINITAVNGTAVYTLTPSDSDEEILGVKAVELNDRPLDPTMPELVETSSGTPNRFYFEPVNQLTLAPTPDAGVAGDALQVRIAVQPTLTATSLADDIVREHRQCIVDGALAWLLRAPKQPWSDPQGALAYERGFMAKTMRAKEAAMRTHMPWGVGVRRPVFAVR